MNNVEPQTPQTKISGLDLQLDWMTKNKNTIHIIFDVEENNTPNSKLHYDLIITLGDKDIKVLPIINNKAGMVTEDEKCNNIPFTVSYGANGITNLVHLLCNKDTLAQDVNYDKECYSMICHAVDQFSLYKPLFLNVDNPNEYCQDTVRLATIKRLQEEMCHDALIFYKDDIRRLIVDKKYGLSPDIIKQDIDRHRKNGIINCLSNCGLCMSNLCRQ
ncbi:MAG: hypothetical protein IJT15_02665 [Rickettsiales bacterium]|nr:hypothetical protein [Rickettsiales bacterium]